jgi:hypothetical protein
MGCIADKERLYSASYRMPSCALTMSPCTFDRGLAKRDGTERLCAAASVTY